MVNNIYEILRMWDICEAVFEDRCAVFCVKGLHGWKYFAAQEQIEKAQSTSPHKPAPYLLKPKVGNGHQKTQYPNYERLQKPKNKLIKYLLACNDK